MNPGKIFEQDFKDSFPKEGYIYRLKDAAGNIDKNVSSTKKRFTISNIADFIAYYEFKFYIFELKSTQLKSLPFSNVNIKHLKEMVAASMKKGVYSFLIINFRITGETYALNCDLVLDYFNSGYKSIPIKLCNEKGILIPERKKKIRFNYDLSFIFKDDFKKDK